MRFGNNNWTPVRARSFAEPVERLIAVTSEQLHDLYARGLYVVGQSVPVEEMAHQIEIQNLMARINLPMSAPRCAPTTAAIPWMWRSPT